MNNFAPLDQVIVNGPKGLRLLGRIDHDDDDLLDAVTHLGLTDRHLEYVQDFILEDLRTTDWDGLLDDEEEDEE